MHTFRTPGSLLKVPGVLFYLLISVFVLPIHTLAQDTINISGRVYEIENGFPIHGAYIVGLGETTQDTLTTTDSSGYFQIASTYMDLWIEYPSYTGQAFFNLQNGQVLNVSLGALEVVASPQDLPIADYPIQLIRPSKAVLGIGNAPTVTDILNYSPGFFVQEGAYNTQRITARGIGNRSPFSTTRLRAYFDNIPLTNGSGESLLEDFSPTSFDFAHLIKGPRGTKYSTPLGGNILLKSQPQSRKTLGGTLNLLAGSYGLLQVNGGLDLPSNQRGLHRIKLNITHSDGYRNNNQFDRQQALYSGRIFYQNPKHQTDILVLFNNLKAQIPSSLGRTDFLENPREAAFTWGRIEGFEDYFRLMAGVTHSIQFIDRTNLQFSNSTSLFGQYRDNFELRPFNLLQEENGWYGLRSLFTIENPDQWSGTLGTEIFLEDYSWTTNDIIDLEPDSLLSDNQEDRRHINLFAEGSASWDRLTATAGLGLQFSTYDYEDRFLTGPLNRSATFSFAPILSPKLSLEYSLPNGNLNGNISRGFALPTLEETLLPDGQRNPDIKPETGWNFEIGIQQYNLFNRLYLGLVLYHLRVNNLLVARRTDEDAFVSINAGSTTHTGIETYGRLFFLRNDRSQLDLQWSYTYNYHRFEEFIDDLDDFSGNKLTGSPPHVVRLGLTAKIWRRLSVLLQYRFVDAFPMNDANTNFSDAYQLLDLNLEYAIELGSTPVIKDLTFFLFLQNLTNTRYASMISVNAVGFGGAEPRYFYPGLPFNVRGGLQVNFGQQ